jgi:ATP-dependent DNA helicase PIF1
MRQTQALTVLLSGANVFLTGAPGSGKTYVLNDFVRKAKILGKRVAVTATTGIAASHINGTTLHSWSGLGILGALQPQDLKNIVSKNYIVNRYLQTDILVIDEISMLHGARLNMVNQLAKHIRGNDEAFGGMQIILVGDLFQLPPVNRNSMMTDFVHLSEAWAELDLRICYLNEQHRQQKHDGLLDLLEAMRSGDITDEHIRLLTLRLDTQPVEGTVVTRLFSHNVDVDSLNQRYLKALPGESTWYRMQTKGRHPKLEQLAKTLLVPEYLELKIGAEIMFVANDFAEGFVNGSRGKIVDIVEDIPVIQLATGRTIYVQPHTWTLNEDGKIKAEITQLPVRLAWAITIHKSQGMSLDAAEIDLSKSFSPGMGYVALSRVRSLDGLYLHGLNSISLSMHPQISELDNHLKYVSTDLSRQTPDLTDELLDSMKEKSIVDTDLYEILKQWRYNRAKTDNLPPYIIAHDVSLSAVATKLPTSIEQLATLSGFGARKLELYGPEIIYLVKEHLTNEQT